MVPITRTLPKTEAAKILDQRGSIPRNYRNSLVFLAPDRNRLSELEQAVRQFRAWRSIENEIDTLNLDAFQSNQTKTKREQADETIKQRISETYQWLLVPSQNDPRGEHEWQEIRLAGQEALAVRASKKLKNDELLVTEFAGTRLRLELDRIPLCRRDQVPLKQLAEDFAKYLYLPRLRDQYVLIGAVEDGLKLITWEKESFAYADGWDESNKRYRGLRRVSITSCRDALNGYQKGKCFYCFADISIDPESPALGEVDHFFPHELKRFSPKVNLDGIWNLVLACK